MKSIPVDTSKLTTLVAGPAQPATNPDGTPRKDRSGNVLTNVTIVVVGPDGSADTMSVRLTGAVPQLAALTPVKLVGLTARPWSMEGRSGVTFSAEAMQPATARS